MRQKIYYLLAICIGILPVNIGMVWYRLTHISGFTISDMLTYPLLFGGGNIVLILLLNRFLLKKGIKEFNPGKSKWYWDILAAVILTTSYFLLLYAERPVLGKILPQGHPPSQEVLNLMTSLANNPFYLAIWLGPVVWIGVALFEEVSRVFFLNCLWYLNQKRYWEWFAILLVSISWGFMHFYQGPFGVVSVSLQGIVMGSYFYKFHRIWPLVISHALFDSFQIITFVLQVS